MILQNIKRTNRVKSGKRVGRGYGSGKGGHTSGRGQKGQKSRSGHKSTIMFEGGNVPLFRRLPKYRGQKNASVRTKPEIQVVNLAQLEKLFDNGSEVSLDSLKKVNLIKSDAKFVKILGVGDLTKKLEIKGIPLSESAKSKIKAAKGSIS